jgi:hypothetical protein
MAAAAAWGAATEGAAWGAKNPAHRHNYRFLLVVKRETCVKLKQ